VDGMEVLDSEISQGPAEMALWLGGQCRGPCGGDGGKQGATRGNATPIAREGYGERNCLTNPSEESGMASELF
jgi:hypothetical protein